MSDLARRLVEHPRFEWREGMRVCSEDWEPWRLGDGDDAPAPDDGEWPDLSDAATAGVLLDMLPDYGKRVLAYIGQTALPPFEVSCIPQPSAGRVYGEGATLNDAIAEALLAHWNSQC